MNKFNMLIGLTLVNSIHISIHDAYLAFGLAEAKALIVQHQAAVLAIANALMVHRTLDAVMIHEIIARAPERARRAAWKIVEKNAAVGIERVKACKDDIAFRRSKRGHLPALSWLTFEFSTVWS
jgi:hypothetical protein